MTDVEWTTSIDPVPYLHALNAMETRVRAIQDGLASEQIWLLEHPPVYTGGTSANSAELISPGNIPVYRCGRGGRFTYHGPGQRIAYVMLDLNNREKDVRKFVGDLENWLILALNKLEITAMKRNDRVGIWSFCGDGTEAKIASIGVRISRWITYHGVSINVAPDIAAFNGIVPCGIANAKMTSLSELSGNADMAKLDEALIDSFSSVFS